MNLRKRQTLTPAQEAAQQAYAAAETAWYAYPSESRYIAMIRAQNAFRLSFL